MAVGLVSALMLTLGLLLGPSLTDAALAATNADLSITKTDSPDPVRVAQKLTYSLKVQNAGPGTAEEVSVNDTLPSGVAFYSADSSCNLQPSESGVSKVTCDVGTMDSGDIVTRKITVIPTKAGTLKNKVEVSSSTKDQDLANNKVAATTKAEFSTGKADLSIEKDASVGEDVTYTLTVTYESGKDKATRVTVIDTLPVGVTYKSSDSRCKHPSERIVVCVLGRMSPDDAFSIDIVVTPAVADADVTLTNNAIVISSTKDTDPANNTDSVSTMISGGGDQTGLQITKTAPSSAAVGEDVTYTLAVHNGGPDDATEVTVTDPLPSGATFKSADSGCTNASGTVTCDLGTIANGEDATKHISVTATSAGTLSNTATVNPGGDSSTASTTVTTTSSTGSPSPGTTTSTPPPSGGVNTGAGGTASGQFPVAVLLVALGVLMLGSTLLAIRHLPKN
jgi:uncharacterized repeat protein (TIGR01451 family)